MTDTEGDEQARVEAAIAALEAQRSTLGDDVVETAVAPLRAQLAKFQKEPRTRRRQVTIMFADITGYTTLSEGLDPERIAMMLSGFWSHVDEIIEQHGGRVFAHMADGVLAVWGADVSTEHDAERAVDAGLAIVHFVEEQGVVVGGTQLDAAMSVGINTGLAHLVDLESETVVGDSVNVAARLEGAAEPGEVVVSKSTFGQIRGIYDAEDAGELALKGRAERVRAYRIMRRRPRAFPAPTWSIEGIETLLAGRDAEFGRIVGRHERTILDREPSSVLVVGEPGVGKSRLLHECRDWLETVNKTRTRYFEGRCHRDSADQPFSLVRSILTNRFEISDSDGAAIAQEKVAAGVAGLLPDASPSMVSSLAWLIGLATDDGVSAAEVTVRRSLAVADVADLLHNLSDAEMPAMLVLEDLHWADTESLDLIERVVRSAPTGLAVLATARERFRDRRPSWVTSGSLAGSHEVIELGALSVDAVDALLDDMLQRAERVPDELRRVVREQGDGNPFHVEEIVKMLIDDGVISTGDAWTVDVGRLDERRIPSSLTGVLQSRLDRLAPQDFELLQAASVFGRTFWVSGLAELLPDIDVEAATKRLSDSELVHRQPTSRFAGATEMVFRHDMTRKVTFETIGLDARAPLHASAASWLANTAGERADEYALVIARHLDEAGRVADAAHWYQRAGRHTQRQSAPADAARWFTMALERTDDLKQRNRLTFELCNAQVTCGQFNEAIARLRWLIDDPATPIDVAKNGRADLARILMLRDGDFEGAHALLAEAVALAAPDRTPADRNVRHQLGNLYIVQGDYAAAIRTFEENLDEEETSGLAHRPGWGLNSLVHALAHDGQYDRATTLGVEAIALSDELQDPRLQMATRAQVGLVALLRGDGAAALAAFEDAQVLNRRNGDLEKLSTVASYIGESLLELHRADDAAAHFEEAVTVSLRAEIRIELVRGVLGLAAIAAERGDVATAEIAMQASLVDPAAGAEARRLASKVAERHALAVSVDDAASDSNDLSAVARRLLAGEALGLERVNR